MSFPVPDGDAIVDGRFVPAAEASLPISDPSVQSGLGVFETLAVRSGRILDLDEHVARLGASAARAGVPLPEPDVVRDALRAFAARRAGSAFVWVKMIAVRSGRFIVFGGDQDPADEGRVSTAVVLPWKRAGDDALSGVKSTSYGAFLVGLEYARSRGADEGLFRNAKGHLLEGSSSNVFAVRGKAIFTPAVREGVLEGTTRSHALRAARELGLSVHEGRVRVERLRRADEAFLTSSLRGVRPLVALDGKPIGKGVPGPWTAEISRRVARARYGDVPAPANA